MKIEMKGEGIKLNITTLNLLGIEKNISRDGDMLCASNGLTTARASSGLHRPPAFSNEILIPTWALVFSNLLSIRYNGSESSEGAVGSCQNICSLKMISVESHVPLYSCIPSPQFINASQTISDFF
jgi:hypothetical protein